MASDEQERCTRMLLDAISAFQDEWEDDSKYADILKRLNSLEEDIEKLDPSADPEDKDDKPGNDADADEPKDLKSASVEARQRLRDKRRASYKQDQASRGDKAA